MAAKPKEESNLNPEMKDGEGMNPLSALKDQMYAVYVPDRPASLALRGESREPQREEDRDARLWDNDQREVVDRSGTAECVKHLVDSAEPEIGCRDGVDSVGTAISERDTGLREGGIGNSSGVFATTHIRRSDN